MDLKGRWVRFAIQDIYFPPPERLLMQLHGGDVMSGTVVDVSDGGPDSRAFVVVSVDKFSSPVVVAVDRISDKE